MGQLLHQAKEYLKYKARAKSGHGIHSPFVYGLIEEVIQNQSQFYCFEEIERCREELEHSTQVIARTDLGARKGEQSSTVISAFAKRSLSTPKQCRFLFQLARYTSAKHVLELGSALGISTAYIANAASHVTTVEGDPELYKLAREQWGKMKLQNIESHNLDFDHFLSTQSITEKKWDMIFIDGNHRKEPTIRYVEQLLPALNEDGLMILDDIHWSEEMTEAWNELRQRNDFNITLDLFHVGILAQRLRVPKQHFILRF